MIRNTASDELDSWIAQACASHVASFARGIVKESSEERKKIAAELLVDPANSEVVALHPTALARYVQQLAGLQDVLSKGICASDSETAEAIRELIDTVTVHRDSSRSGGVTVEIAGRLNVLLGEQATKHAESGERW